MFRIYFGKYLEDKGIITYQQYHELLEQSKNKRVKLGLLAVEMDYMSKTEAEEVNHLQTVLDQRFGDIAVDKGYLTPEQVERLLKKQGDPYMLFIQELTENNIMNLEQIQKELKNYKKAERFTALDLDAIKSGDIDNIVPVFTKEPSIAPVIKDYIALFARNMIRFIDTQLRLENAVRINSYQADFMASQAMEGQYNMFIGISGESDAVVDLASIYCKEQFEEVNEDVLDAVCEFINCNNGLFASKLSEEDIDIDMLPPVMYTEKTCIRSEGAMYKIPLYISGEHLDLIICMETKWSIE